MGRNSRGTSSAVALVVAAMMGVCCDDAQSDGAARQTTEDPDAGGDGPSSKPDEVDASEPQRPEPQRPEPQSEGGSGNEPDDPGPISSEGGAGGEGSGAEGGAGGDSPSTSAGGDGASGAGGVGGATGSAGTSSAGTGSAGTGSAPVDETYADSCPGALPESGNACDDEGRRCTYGREGAVACRDAALCTTDGWAVEAGTCDEVTECPAPAVHREPCAEPRDRCQSSTGDECLCVELQPEPAWLCDVASDANRNPDCPSLVPNAGTVCTGSLTCMYSRCEVLDSMVQATCDDSGAWVLDEQQCEMVGGG
jgi:hypothetical protein